MLLLLLLLLLMLPTETHAQPAGPAADPVQAGAGCSPVGLYFAARDMVGRADPIWLNASTSTAGSSWADASSRRLHLPAVAIAAVAAPCPGQPTARYVASTLRFWKDVPVCGYANGSLYKADDGQTAAVGPGCHVVEWADPLPKAGRFLWCRSTATKSQCVPVLPPAPPTPPSPPAPPPPATPTFGPLYGPLPVTAVGFSSSDAALAGLVEHAAELARLNIKPFRRLPDGSNLSVMEEGAQFHGAWLETQPMAGAMYATRDCRVALNNQLIFMRAQASDGYMPGQVNGGRRVLRPVAPAASGGGGGGIQGLFFASPAVDMAWYLEQGGNATAVAAFNLELASVLEAYDGWLWTARNTTAMCRPASFGCVGGAGRPPRVGYGRGGTNATACCRGDAAGTPPRGLLWSSGVIDSGEDSSTRFCKVANHTGYAPCVSSYAFPIQSADVTSYSYDCRSSLARLARMRGDAQAAAAWAGRAASLAANLKVQLWIESERAMFARDAADEVVDTLVHDSLRVMWQGAFDQGMADAFVTGHLLNESEFWTPVPLPSISVADPRYNALTPNANSWSGRPMGLTFQRAIRALERYGHHAEVTMIGQRLSEAILGFDGCAAAPAEIENATSRKTACHFTLEIDPFTSTPMWAPWSPADGYGPMLMAFLEYTALRLGLVPRPPDASMGPLRGGAATLFWSAVPNTTAASPAISNYSQVLGGSTFTLLIDGPKGEMGGFVDRRRVFTASLGVRVVTSLSGKVVGLIGIDSATTTVTLAVPGGGGEVKQVIKPNEEWGVSSAAGGTMTLKRLRAAPFVKPYKSDDETDLSTPNVSMQHLASAVCFSQAGGVGKCRPSHSIGVRRASWRARVPLEDR
eukprot:SAG11_NODE_1954_length_4006_cov_1.667093_1_plen_862_part_00